MSLATSLLNTLASLFGASALFDSHTRLYDLDIQGFAPGELLIEGFRGVEALDQLPLLELLCLSQDTTIDMARFTDKQIRLLISLPDGSRTCRTGYITAAHRLGSHGLARYRLLVSVGAYYATLKINTRVFHHTNRMAVVEEVLAEYSPYVHWKASADVDACAAAHAERETITQYRETDFHFIARLLSESGLSFRFAEDGESVTSKLTEFARHHLMIFADSSRLPEAWASSNALGGQGVRFHRSASQEDQDAITFMSERVRGRIPQQFSAIAWTKTGKHSHSAVYETPNLPGKRSPEQFFSFSELFTNNREVEDRLVQMANRVINESIHTFANGTLRGARSGEHLCITGDVKQSLASLLKQKPAESPRYLISSHRYAGINNLPKDARSSLDKLLGGIQTQWTSHWPQKFDGTPDPRAEQDDTPSGAQPILFDRLLASQGLPPLAAYEMTATAVANAFEPEHDPFSHLVAKARAVGFAHDSRLITLDQPWAPEVIAKPTMTGPLSALVVGPEGETSPSGNQVVYTDKLGRVKVRFHFGNESAPANLSAWLRVIQRMAGGGRGTHFTPRIGSEASIAFEQGDIDRPYVATVMYDGQGEGDVTHTPARHSLSDVTATSSADDTVFAQAKDHSPAGQGNLMGGQSPVWHGAAAGDANHKHGGALLGLRSQSWDDDGHNQLLFDDSDQQLSVQLATTQYASQVNLGHMIHRADNYRGSFRGHGWEMRTDAYGALRAGAGLLITTYPLQHTAQNHDTAADTSGPMALVRQAGLISQSLSDISHTHKGLIAGAVAGSSKTSQSLLDHKAAPLNALLTTVQGQVSAKDHVQAFGDANNKNIAAKPNSAKAAGTVPAFTDAILAIAARGGILATAQHGIFTSNETQHWLSGGHFSIGSGNQIRLDAGQAISIIGGVAQGSKENGIGLSLITGEGDLLVQSQNSTIMLASKGTLSIESAKSSVHLFAAKEIVIKTAGGAGITMSSSGFTAECSGQMTIHASAKQLNGGASVNATLPAMPHSAIAPEKLKFAMLLQDTPGPHGMPLPNRDWKIVIAKGNGQHLPLTPKEWDKVLFTGTSSASGEVTLTEDQQKELWKAASLHINQVYLVSEAKATPINRQYFAANPKQLEQAATLDSLNYAPARQLEDEVHHRLMKTWAESEFEAPLGGTPKTKGKV